METEESNTKHEEDEVKENPGLSPEAPQSEHSEIQLNEAIPQEPEQNTQENSAGKISEKTTPQKHIMSYKVEERTVLWKQKMEERIKEVRDSEKDKELDGCTFKPALIANNRKSSKGSKASPLVSQKSYDKYIEKRKSFKEATELNEQQINMRPGYGTNLC